MKITKIVYRSSNDNDKAIAECDVVFDDALKVTNIRLYHRKDGFYLIFPSKQDMANEMLNENKGKDIVTPSCLSPDRKKNWEEFYYPIDASFYAVIRDTVVEGFNIVKNRQSKTYIP